MAENRDYTKYPEGLKALAEDLQLPIPAEETAKREMMTQMFINSLLRA